MDIASLCGFVYGNINEIKAHLISEKQVEIRVLTVLSYLQEHDFECRQVAALVPLNETVQRKANRGQLAVVLFTFKSEGDEDQAENICDAGLRDINNQELREQASRIVMMPCKVIPNPVEMEEK